MKGFADLNLRPSQEAKTQERLAEVVRDLGFSMVAASHVDGSVQESFRNLLKGKGVDMATRVDIRAKNRNQLLTSLRRLRDAFEIVAVECLSPQAAVVAVRDRRVDLVCFNPRNPSVKFRGSLARICNASYEVTLSKLIYSRPDEFPRLLARVKDEVRLAVEKDVAVVVSSGAENPLMLRGPLEMAAFAKLVGLVNSRAAESVSKAPLDLVHRNRLRLSESYVTEGVRILRTPRRDAEKDLAVPSNSGN